MMNKFAKTMSNTSYKLKQKAGMTEKTVDQEFETTRAVLTELIDNATNICKSFVKHAESLEALAPSKQLSEPYKLSLDSSTDINTDLQDLYRQIGQVATEHGDKKRDVVTSTQKYILELQAVKEKVKKRDELLLSYDKHNEKLQSMSSKSSKDENKYNVEKLKTQQYKDQLDALNREIVDTVQTMHDNQQQNLSPALHMMIASQLNFFDKMATVYQSSAVAY